MYQRLEDFLERAEKYNFDLTDYDLRAIKFSIWFDEEVKLNLTYMEKVHDDYMWLIYEVLR